MKAIDGDSPDDYWKGVMPTGIVGKQPYAPLSTMTAPTGITTGQGVAPAPHPAAPAAPAALQVHAPATPAPAPAPLPTAAAFSAPVSSGLSNPSTGQTSPSVGTPSGYNVSNGINTATSALLPTGFNVGTLTGGGTIPDAPVPSGQSVVGQGAADQQNPTNWTVDPNQTVQGQYAGLMSKGNMAIQAAEEAVTRKYAASGGRNDLMAAGASAVAGSGVALQIASQDAQTYAAAGQFNAAAANTFKEQLNQFTDNALLSKQNFDQGVAMLKDQSNQQIEQLYAQVQANAATQSTNLKATLATLQGQTNATLEQMDKQFSQNVAMTGIQEADTQANAAQAESYTNQNAWTQYGMSVRMGYLTSVSQQQQSLMQTMGEIRANPNITAAQASAATTDAINQFNTFMTMNNAYFASMVPTGSGLPTPGQAAGQTAAPYTTAAYNYTQYNPATFPHA